MLKQTSAASPSEKDIINLNNGWVLSSLCKTPVGYQAVIEKEFAMDFHPYRITRFKIGNGPTQKEAINAALKSRGYAQENTLHGTKYA